MKDKKPELQLQLIEVVEEDAPRKRPASERASMFIADINLLYTEVLLIEDRLEGESEYVRGKLAALSIIKHRLKAAIEKL
jgi:hypothetical protein